MRLQTSAIMRNVWQWQNCGRRKISLQSITT